MLRGARRLSFCLPQRLTYNYLNLQSSYRQTLNAQEFSRVSSITVISGLVIKSELEIKSSEAVILSRFSVSVGDSETEENNSCSFDCLDNDSYSALVKNLPPVPLGLLQA